MRNSNTDRGGRAFSRTVIDAVWAKGASVPGYDPSQFRKDGCGAFMKRSDYGDTNSQYGWEVDHVVPVAAGGSDDIYNLQPLQWRNNRHKGDSYPRWSCAISAR